MAAGIAAAAVAIPATVIASDDGDFEAHRVDEASPIEVGVAFLRPG
ncbi:hypothetical protein [Saccharothrix xinjiangensis]|uniref:Uncharacterized protein n=1 Tax=Saccharothrix xinjiangensis TaxID=204798 RepID=A0ABV9XZX1_9PSEU